MILSLCVNPVIQKTIIFSTLNAGSVNRAEESYWDASGKGLNVCRVLTQLGEPCVLLTQTGGTHKKWFSEMAIKDGVKIDEVDCPNFEIRSCTTVINKRNCQVTELVEEGHRVSEAVEIELRNKLNVYSNQKDVEMLIISGSKAPGFSDNFFPEITQMFLNKQIPVIADFRGKDAIKMFDLCKNFNDLLVFKPNYEEFCSTFNCTLSNIKKRMFEMATSTNCAIIVTHGKKAIYCVKPSDKEVYLTKVKKYPKNKIINTTGCGDSFTAGFASVWLKNLKKTFNIFFDEAIDEGIRCGALNAFTIHPGSINEN